MPRSKIVSRRSHLILLGIWLCSAATASSADVEVAGMVRMPDVCSPSVSPAVVYLVPADATENRLLVDRDRHRDGPNRSNRAEVVLVNQRGLQFVPRVRAIALGQTMRFTNEDGETHNVHVVSPGFPFNQSMSPGQYQDFTPTRPGVMRLACDIHQHMRGYVIVSPTPLGDGLRSGGAVPAR